MDIEISQEGKYFVLEFGNFRVKFTEFAKLTQWCQSMMPMPICLKIS
jgi:hypothetical protein